MMKEGNNEVYLAISPQSLSSLSNYFQIEDDLLTFRKLQTVFNQIGIKQTYDLSFFNSLALHLSYDEFITRYNNSPLSDPEYKPKKGLKYNYNINLPILTSECPGWVCYAEKTVGEEAIPFMSKVKSPQQLWGRMVKQQMQKEVKTVTIMPCYDKKLEAVRPTVNIKQSETELKPQMEVDTVLATHELLELFQKEGIDFKSIEPHSPEAEMEDEPSSLLDSIMK